MNKTQAQEALAVAEKYLPTRIERRAEIILLISEARQALRRGSYDTAAGLSLKATQI